MKTRLLKPFSLSLPQFNVLNILNNQFPEPSTVKLLADRMLDETSNVSRLVDKLKRKGFIEKKGSTADRRKVEISITDAGLTVFVNAANALENTTEFQLGNLSESEIQTLNRLLDKTRSK